ncbi:MAG: hypothetical protein QOE08_1316 [Thermoleophilaceae bacterium]|jgi:hypothetical protein|nr:hypothetical protein [Thermoleophilaceae bacterium]
MSQFAHPSLGWSSIRSHRVAVMVTVLVLAAASALALVLLIDGGSSHPASSPSAQQGPATRPDGGPDESAVAADVSRQQFVAPTRRGPDESRTAAAISGR